MSLGTIFLIAVIAFFLGALGSARGQQLEKFSAILRNDYNGFTPQEREAPQTLTFLHDARRLERRQYAWNFLSALLIVASIVTVIVVGILAEVR